MRRVIASLASLVLPASLLAGCAGSGSSPVASTASTAAGSPATTPAVTSTVLPSTPASAPVISMHVVSDVVYQDATVAHGLPSAAKLLDVYVPDGVVAGPVVVLFHAAGFSKDGDREGPGGWDALTDLASSVAQRGAVAFVPTWRNATDWEGPVDDPDRRISEFTNDADAARCAVSFALAHAAEYRADPATLVLVGRSAGSNMAAAAALGAVTPVPGCAVPAEQFVADGLVLWEGDWLLSDSGYDIYKERLIQMLDAVTPWSRLANGPPMSVDLITTAGFRLGARRCQVAADPKDPYFTLRDPKGAYRLYERFTAIDAMADGCVDVGEVDQVLGAAMTDAGFDASVLRLEHGEHGNLGVDQPLVVAEILVIANR